MTAGPVGSRAVQWRSNGCCGVRRAAPPAETPYPVGAGVRHREWGEGTVLQAEADRITVLFASAGYRTLSLESLREQHLVEKIAGSGFAG